MINEHYTVPNHWTPQEALAVTNFLEELMSRIWDKHGDRMVPLIIRQNVPEPPETDIGDPDFPDFIDDPYFMRESG